MNQYPTLPSSHKIFQAARHGDLEYLKVQALEHGTQVIDEDQASLVIYAAQEGHNEIIVWLLDHGAKIDLQDYYGFTALSFAIQENHLETVKLLIKRGSNPEIVDQDGDTPRKLAMKSENQSIRKLFL